VVFVDIGGGRLQPRDVELGQRVEGLAEIRSGLVEGEQVALGASFLLDSESRLKAAVSAMGAPAAPSQKPPSPKAGDGGQP
jgi:Cu(I)/Ag(I) efflux system membrane fusion protein